MTDKPDYIDKINVRLKHVNGTTIMIRKLPLATKVQIIIGTSQ